MNSPKPYLLRAFYDWIVDNGHTPYVLVDAQADGVLVPQDYVQEGKIVLNIAPSAVYALVMNKDRVSFSARFRGVSREIDVPMSAVKAVYAKENGRGMVFPEDDAGEVGADAGSQQTRPTKPTRKGPQLKLVK